MSTFTFHRHDFGDSYSSDYGTSVWVAAYVDGDTSKPIGAYVYSNGDVSFRDEIAWRIEYDLSAMGVDPESDAADELLNQWKRVAREHGLKLLEIFGGSE